MSSSTSPIKAVEDLWGAEPPRKKKDGSADEQVWSRQAFVNGFDDKVAYRLFGKQIEALTRSFSRKRQLYVSTWRGVSRLRDLELNSEALNALFNPLAEDPESPMQLVGIECERVSLFWKSLFTMWREPLEVKIPRLEIVMDAGAKVPDAASLAKIRSHWLAISGPPQRPTNHPPIEGARYSVDEVVVFIRNYATPLPGAKNSTARIILRNVEASSVDREGKAQNLRVCWLSFNSPSALKQRTPPAPPRSKKKPLPLLIISKRIVASDVEIDLAPTQPPPYENFTYVTRLLEVPRAAALVTVGYEGLWEMAHLRFDVWCDQLDLDLPEPTLAEPSPALLNTLAFAPAAQPSPPPQPPAQGSPTSGPNFALRFQFGRLASLASQKNGRMLSGEAAPEDASDDDSAYSSSSAPQPSSSDLGSFLVQFNNSIIRPIVAVSIFLWSLRLV